ncbi:DUF6069 family protein [Actinomadura flavalba]|uniref:DUF6069 family protein n=1 Tax=Actinomadura flavalba TaxID=1120938 RepID=UPI000368C1FE|nr:DUF6069 family protein [Actinomadura flavalba]
MSYETGNMYPEYPERPGPPGDRPRPGVNAGRLWAGGAATALVAAFIGVVGVLVARGVLDIPVWLPAGQDRVADGTALGVAVFGAIAAITATALLHLLMLTTPSPRQFFAWIVALATIVGVVWPFTTGVSLESQVAQAIIAGLTGLAIGTLLTSVASSSVRA